MLVQVVLGFLITALTYFYWSRKFALRKWQRLGIPGPEPSFWFGNAKELAYGRKETWKVLETWRKKYGRVYGFYMGLRPTLHVMDAQIVKEILVGQFSNFVNRPHVLQNMKHIVALRGRDWKEVRKLMNPIFTTRKLKNMTTMMNDIENTMIDIMSEKVEKAEEIPTYALTKAVTFQIIAKTAFAMDVPCQRDENDPFYLQIKKWLELPYSIFGLLVLMFPGLAFMFRFLSKFGSRSIGMNDIQAHITNILDYRQQNPEVAPGDLVELMLAAREGKVAASRYLKTNMLLDDSDEFSEKETLSKLPQAQTHPSKRAKYLASDAHVVDNLIFVVMAGFDSTSNTMAFAMHFLAMHPEVQEKAYAEIIQHIGDSDHISADDYKKLKYLEQVIFETLRLYPPVPIFLHRECIETVTINGVTIPKGTVVETPPWLLHRDPEYWPDPDKFDPERFAPGNQTESQRNVFVPFGAGPKMCLGAKFAMIELVTSLAKVVKRFKICKGPQFKETINLKVSSIVLNAAEEIYVTLRNRTDDNANYT